MTDDPSRSARAEQAHLLPDLGLQALDELMESQDSALRRAMQRVAHDNETQPESYAAFGNTP